MKKSYLLVALIIAGCLSACSSSATTVKKQAEINLKCDKQNNSFHFDFAKFVKGYDITGFTMIPAQSIKTSFQETCALADSINIEIDIDLKRTSKFFVGKIAGNSGTSHILEKSSMDIYLKDGQRVIATILGINYKQNLSIDLENDHLVVCTNQQCSPYSLKELIHHTSTPYSLVGQRSIRID